MEITANETGFNEEGSRKGKVTIVTKANTFTIHTDYVDDAHYLANVFEDVAEEIEIVENKPIIHEDLRSLLDRTKEVFVGSFVNRSNELIFDGRSNLYFRLDDVETVLEFKCKMMAWLSRTITKSLSDYKARIVLQRFNELLGTNFSRADMELIYDRLGNGVAKTLCIEFIEL